jgi:hypothetical protein
MKAPSEFCVYGFATALYTGPREKNLLQRFTANTTAAKIKYYQIEVYEDAEIREAEVIPDFNKENLPLSADDLFLVRFTTEPEIHFKETVFDQINFIRDAITEAYFVNPEITIITKKNDHTYGTIRGWGYFRIGKPVLKNITASVKKEVLNKETTINVFDQIDDSKVASVTPVMHTNSSMGCLPALSSSIFSYSLFGLFGWSIGWSLGIFVLLLLLLMLLFRSNSRLKQIDGNLTYGSTRLIGNGGLLTLLAVLLFLGLMLFTCNKFVSTGNAKTVVIEESAARPKLNTIKPTVLGERVVIPKINNVDEIELAHVLKPDSIMINKRMVAVPISDRFQFLIYDYGSFDQDEVTIQFNDEIIEKYALVPEYPEQHNLSSLKAGENYLYLTPTSNGKVGNCTPHFVLIRNGKIYFEKSFSCVTGEVKQITFVNKAWD